MFLWNKKISLFTNLICRAYLNKYILKMQLGQLLYLGTMILDMLSTRICNAANPGVLGNNTDWLTMDISFLQ